MPARRFELLSIPMSNNTRPCALITGAAGFLGAHVTRELLSLNSMEVVALDDLSGGFRQNIPDGVEFVQGSVCDTALLAELFEKYRFRYVYHLAAYAAEGLSHFIRRFNYTNNLIGSVNLINEAVKTGTESFVFTSSIAVYGAIEPPMVEHKTPHPEDPYGVAKYAVELDLKVAHEMFGLNYVIFRPHNVYGEYQNLADPYRNVIGIFMKQIREGTPLTIFGDGNQQRAFTYVGDIAPYIAQAPFVQAARNDLFNVGADEPYTINTLADEVCLAMGKPGHPRNHLPPRNEVVHAWADHSKVRAVFGGAHQTTLREGLTRMSDWAKTVTLPPLNPFTAIEIRKNLPGVWEKFVDEVSLTASGTVR
jgi:UDP-glucose 4-epimerase